MPDKYLDQSFMYSKPRYHSVLLWKAMLLISSIITILVAIVFIDDHPQLNRDWTKFVTIVFSLWFVMYVIATYKYFKSVYLFSSAYISVLAIFHLGHTFSDSVGWFSAAYLVSGSMAKWYEQAGWYCMLTFGSIGLGMALSMKSMKSFPNEIEHNSKEIKENQKVVFWIGIALFCAAVVSIILLVGSVGNVFKYSRADIFRGVGDTRGLGFFLVVMPSAIVLLVVSAKSYKEKLFAYSSAVFVVLFIFFLGYRSSVLFPALIGVILWIKLGKKIPITVLIVSIMIVLITIPTVRYLRTAGPYQDVSKEDLSKSIKKSNVQDVFVEIGGVITIVANVVKWVPDEYPYRYGQSYLLALGTSIPNIGFIQTRSTRKDFLSKGKVDKKVLQYMHPADWYTYLVDRWAFDRGLGVGFSTIAEAYLNFGTVGVFAYFIFLGYLLGTLDHKDLRRHSSLTIFSGAMLWPLLKTVRNSFGVFLKPVVFILICILIWKVITFWKTRPR